MIAASVEQAACLTRCPPSLAADRRHQPRHKPLGRKHTRRPRSRGLAVRTRQRVVFQDPEGPAWKLALGNSRHDPAGLAVNDKLPGCVALDRHRRQAAGHPVEDRPAEGDPA